MDEVEKLKYIGISRSLLRPVFIGMEKVFDKFDGIDTGGIQSI